MPTPETSPGRARMSAAGLSPAQLGASALAAATATFAASYFGVKGTVLGAVLASVVATLVSGVSHHSFQRWPRLALSAAVVVAITLAGLTGLEGALGHPLSSLVDHSSTTGTSIGDLASGRVASYRPAAPAHPHPDARAHHVRATTKHRSDKTASSERRSPSPSPTPSPSPSPSPSPVNPVPSAP